MTLWLAPRKLVALVAVIAAVWTGAPPVFAATSERPAGPKSTIAGAPTWFVQVLDAKGNVTDLEKAAVERGTRHPVAPALPGDVAQLRKELQERQKSANLKAASRATRLLRWLDILEAKTAAERHERIRQLPVTVIASPSTDGRDGIVRSFVVGGRTRARLFVPTMAMASVEGVEGERPSGPAAEEPCFNDEPGPCATAQETEDFVWVLVETQNEMESLQAEFDAQYGDYVSYCNENPWNEACQEPETDQVGPSGPSACSAGGRNCYEYAGAAAYGLWATVTGAVHYWGWTNLAAARGVTLAVGTVTAAQAALVGGAFTTGYMVGTFIDCKFISTGR